MKGNLEKMAYNTLSDFLDEIENFSSREERILDGVEDVAKAKELMQIVWDVQQEKVELYRRLVKNLLPKLNGEFFICGHSPKGSDNLPDYISVCPAYGADFSVTYQRTDITQEDEQLKEFNNEN